MRPFLLAAAIAVIGAPALAQTTTTTTTTTPHRRPAVTHGNPYARPSDGRPIDKGPNTPEANKAYNGGGMVIDGPPGGPPPVMTR